MTTLTDDRAAVASLLAGQHHGPYADELRAAGLLTPANVLPLVLAHPACDGLRLLYADAAEEQGDEARAEFVRVQVELADERKSLERFANGDGDRAKYLLGRQRELFRASGPKWWSDLPGTHRATSNDPPRITSADGWEFLVRRGFVARANCTLAMLMGGVCGTCQGAGFIPIYTGHGNIGEPDCDACRGTGTTPGVAGAICAAHPLAYDGVTLTDREPNPNAFGGPRVSWQSDDAALASWAPYGLIVAMYAALEEDADGRTWIVFPTRDAAHATLSAAVVTHCRRLVGLEPLEATA